ncbi:MAG TPA: cytidylate kinase-like family protein [Solirubrobacteraceae bacterium]|nr:cytidylate kinase-like family protein [Solirubrobacteraceae bacterium]
MALVTISAAYGALGSEVGRKLADRLDVPFLDRAITAGVAQRLALPLEEAASLDESPGSRIERLLASFTQMGSLFGVTPVPIEEATDEATFREATEDIIRQHAASGSAVIVGRAAMIVLAEHPHVVRVRLTGPRQARIEQAMRLHALTREQAERGARASDGVREAWVQRFYGRDVKDPSLYDLVINSTRFDSDTCVELITEAVAAQVRG